MDSDDAGFGLVELLVVVVVMAVLAVITFPTLLSQRRSAWVSAAESDLRNAAIHVESQLASGVAYPDTQAAFDALLGGALMQSTEGVVKVGSSASGITYERDGGEYCLTAGHVSIDNGTVVAAYSGMGSGLLDPPTADCS